MKTKVLMAVLLAAGTCAHAQTWLELGQNGMNYGASNPPTTSVINDYSEPFDQGWRKGFTGIGTATWPKTTLHVSGNANVDASLSSFLSLVGANYTDFSSLFTSGGTTGVPLTSSVMGYTMRSEANTTNFAVMGICNGDGNGLSNGVLGMANGDNNQDVYGVQGTVSGVGNNRLAGVFGIAEGDGAGMGNFGVWGQCNSTDAASLNCGVFGRGVFGSNNEPAKVNIGVHGVAECSNSGGGGSQFNCGVFGVNGACSGGTNGGAGYPVGSYAGYFIGDLYYTGALLGPSDQRLKENIKPLEKVTDKLRRLNLYSYNFKQNTGLMLPDGTSYGVIAQELEKVFPELVKDATVLTYDPEKPYSKSTEIKSVQYLPFIPLLLQANKELNDKLDALDPQKTTETLAALREKIAALENNLANAAVTPTGQVAAYLNAYPNPGNTQMTIDVKQPNCRNCSVVITDLSGKLVQQFATDGNQKHTLSAENIGRGIYQCNLVENGSVISNIKIAFTNN